MVAATRPVQVYGFGHRALGTPYHMEPAGAFGLGQHFISHVEISVAGQVVHRKITADKPGANMSVSHIYRIE